MFFVNLFSYTLALLIKTTVMEIINAPLKTGYHAELSISKFLDKSWLTIITII